MFKRLWHNTRAASSGIIATLIFISIGLSVGAAVLPQAIVDISNTTKYTGAPTAVTTLVPVLGVVAIAAVLLVLVYTAIRKR